MVSRGRAVLIGLVQLALTLAYWTPAVMGYAAWGTMKSTGLTPALTFADLRMAFLLSASFMLLSGYFVSVLLLYVFFRRQTSWAERALMSFALYFLSVSIFVLLVGDSPLGGKDLPWILLGAVGVISAEATTKALWYRFGSRRVEKDSIS